MHLLVGGLMLDEDGIPDQGILFRHLPFTGRPSRANTGTGNPLNARRLPTISR